MKALYNLLNQDIEIDKNLILKLISFIDLTTLNNTDNNETVLKLVEKANKGFKSAFPAAICTFSTFGDLVREKLNSKVKCAVVAGSFPTGHTLMSAKICEVKEIAKTNVDEIDIVINRGTFFNGDFAGIREEISEIKKVIGNKHLKVILETGDLETEENIRLASQLAIESGADFIKTSTGKSSIGATPEAIYYMCQEIAAEYKRTGKKVGIKPAGGIGTLGDAVAIYKIVATVLGEDWLNNSLFRIGASSLYDNLITAYNQEA